MPRTGKIDRQFFAEHVATRLGAPREDVRKGPKHGVDFGVVDVGTAALAVATDPMSILPALGFERAGRFAVRIVLADVAVSGLAPTHLAASFSLPPEMEDQEFAAVWRGIDEECTDLGVSVVTGHTARYHGCTFPWVASGTAFAVGDPERIVYPDGARPGDAVVITNGPAVEATGLLTTLFPEQVSLAGETLATAQRRLDDASGIRDALAAVDAGDVSAMHDATEGGLLGALHETAGAAGVRLVVDSESVPIRPGVREACEVLGMDPWRATTAGTLVIAVAPEDADAVVDAVDSPAAVVGRVEAGEGVVLDGERTDPPDGDASWPVYERLLEGRS
jgi:hydrogenase maturation factor